MAATDLSSTIGGLAGNPQQTATDGQQVSERPLTDVIAADRYLAQKAARSQKRRGLMFNKIIPAGCPADQQGTQLGGGANSFDNGLGG
jgi:hypothetical protein